MRARCGRGDGGEGAGGFAAGGGVAFELVFEDEEDALPAGGFGGGAEVIVDGLAEGGGVVDAPEVEAADLVGAELSGEGDGAGEDVGLLLEGGFGGAVEVAGGAVGGFGGSGPVGFEEGAGDVGDLQAVLLEQALGFGDFGVGAGLEVFAPEGAELDVMEAEVVGG